MKIRNFYHIILLPFFCIILNSTVSSAQGCTATTLEEFYTCYGGKSAFSKHSVDAVTAFVAAEDAMRAGNFTQAKLLVENIFNTYPRGNNIWWSLYSDQNGANLGTPHAYYGLRMMEDIVDHELNGNPNVKAEKINMKIVLVGCSQGIQPTTETQLQNGTGPFVTNAISPRLKEDNYRIIKQSFAFFSQYVTAITKGKLAVDVEIVELNNLCLPVNVSTSLPHVASGSMEPVWGELTDAAKDSTDWWLILYPSHVPEFPTFDDEAFITGGMGSDSKGGPVFIADDKWIVRKPAHLGKGDYTDIERRIYLPQWFQHEFFHHLYRIYPDLNLEVNGHDWFDINFWPDDFVGQFEPDYYAETLHKRLQVDCAKLETRLITRVNDGLEAEFKSFSVDELLGFYSLDDIQNPWHEGNIIKEGSKYFWKNNANVKWEVIPNLAKGQLDTGSDSPYPGKDFFIELYRTSEGDYVQGAVALKYQGDLYKKRFNLIRESVPMEIALGLFERVPNDASDHTGNIVKTAGKLYWQNNASGSWSLTPNHADESFSLNSDSPTPGEEFQLILTDSECGLYDLGFKYLDHYYWKPKRDITNGSPTVVNGIADLKLQKNFGSYTINLPDVFADPEGDSLLLFVTSEKTPLITPLLEGQKLTLSGGDIGTTTIYLMALDDNGGLVVDAFEVTVETMSSSDDKPSSFQNITISPSITQDIVRVVGASIDMKLSIISIDHSYKQTIPYTKDQIDIDLSHLPSGIYLLLITDIVTGRMKVEKVVKY
jgi:hypothetical protein